MPLFLSSSLLLQNAEGAPTPVSPAPLHQDIHIAFALESALLQGNATILLPPERELNLSFVELEHIQIEITETWQEANDEEPVPQEIAPNSDKTLSLAPTAQERTLSLSWQVTAPPPGTSGNLISPQGITLTGPWHPTTGEKMLFSLHAELPPGFSGVTEAEKIKIRAEEEQQLFKATSPQPLYSINFAAGPYTVLSRHLNRLTLYSYFFAKDEELAPAYLDRAAEYIQRYEELIGPFPYTRYSIVENRLPTGYGMPGFTLLGQAVVRLPLSRTPR